MIVVTFPRLVACFTDSAPKTSSWFMLRRSRKLHLVHCVFVAEELAAFSAVDGSICGCEPLAAAWFKTNIVRSPWLPMLTCHNFIWIWLFDFDGAGSLLPSNSDDRRGLRILVGLKDIKAFQLLVEYCQWLELLRFIHLSFEPVFDLILFDFF